jgi:hypothetical protein
MLRCFERQRDLALTVVDSDGVIDFGQMVRWEANVHNGAQDLRDGAGGWHVGLNVLLKVFLTEIAEPICIVLRTPIIPSEVRNQMGP